MAIHQEEAMTIVYLALAVLDVDVQSVKEVE